MTSVTRRMLSPRAFFGAGAAATAAATLGATARPTPAAAQASGTITDLTPTYDAEFPTFFGEPGVRVLAIS